MAKSALAYIQEQARQKLNDDSNFLKKMLYFFELIIPAEVGIFGDTDFLFPLIIPPQNYVLEEPFTVEATPTLHGGLYIEENGIIQRTIRLRGHTGFKPRKLNLPNGVIARSSTLPPQKTSHARELPLSALSAISGLRHFQYLQDSVFRTYADLKRDPEYALETELRFHNPKDGEHWHVVPQKFTLERDSSSPHLYMYNIELLVVDKADARNVDFSEDKNWFEDIKDTLRSIKKYADMCAGAFNDLTALVNELTIFIKDIGTILSTVADMLNAVGNFVAGITALIEAPYATLKQVIIDIENASKHLEAQMKASVELERTIPRSVPQKLRIMQDALEGAGMHPSAWETPTNATIRNIKDQQEFLRSISSTRKEEALASEAPTTFDEVRNRGTELTPGDIESAEGEITVGRFAKKYRSAREVAIGEGDTLTGLAARHMGDARLWQHIAIVNGLKPPFIDKQASAPLVSSTSAGSQTTGSATGADESPFAGTLGVGSKILIPTNQVSSLDMPLLPVVGVTAGESAENHFLGTDLSLEAVTDVFGSSRAQYDIPIDTDLGSVDAKVVEGMDNLSQAIIIRLLTDYGTDTLYKRVGIRRVVGLGFSDVDLEIVRFRVLEALSVDPRIALVQGIKFEQQEDNPDQLYVDLNVHVRGFTESRAVTALI